MKIIVAFVVGVGSGIGLVYTLPYDYYIIIPPIEIILIIGILNGWDLFLKTENKNKS